jgi:hypothetical protein
MTERQGDRTRAISDLQLALVSTAQSLNESGESEAAAAKVGVIGDLAPIADSCHNPRPKVERQHDHATHHNSAGLAANPRTAQGSARRLTNGTRAAKIATDSTG